ncbi:hypothetical protein SNE40_021075 [Patella caerulea]|uniref:DNA 3'-5' helicase n=1 Tax=Patella caerulea TaxID=87958 RepID=A0AAN8GJN4_PATCE
MDDHCECFKKWNLSAVKLEPLTAMKGDDVRGIRNGDFRIILSSPETILKKLWKDVLLSDVYQERLILMCIDEAHCISEWGEDFRTEYRQLHELRSILCCPVMILTATSTDAVTNDIFKHLHLSQRDTEIVFKTPDRPNIYIDFVKAEHSTMEKKLKWLIDHIISKGALSKKTIIYCRSIDRVSDIFLTLRETLGRHSYADGIADSEHLIVEMFHRLTHESSKQRILKNFKKTHGYLRCVVATIALGMGIQIGDIDLVVHIGCPNSVISYWQEAGRCARDGRPGYSFVLFDNFTMSQRNTSKDIKLIVQNMNNQCIRQLILQYFRPHKLNEMIFYESTICDGCDDEFCQCQACLCCSVCILKCPCNIRNEFGVVKFLEMCDGPFDHIFQ